MILTEQEIKKILSRIPTVMKSRVLDYTINQYEYTLKELLDLVQTYIYEKKGIDIGTIQEPEGDICPSFLKIVLSKTGVMNMDKGSDFNALNIASDIALNYFYTKYRE